MKTGHTTAVATRKSSRCPKTGGSSRQLSAPGAAQALTPSVKISFGDSTLNLDKETLEILMSLLNGYMSQVMSGDLTALAFYSAKDYAEKAGIPEEKFVQVANEIFKTNNKRRKAHPFVASGFMA
jgi:hypothetical protein